MLEQVNLFFQGVIPSEIWTRTGKKVDRSLVSKKIKSSFKCIVFAICFNANTLVLKFKQLNVTDINNTNVNITYICYCFFSYSFNLHIFLFCLNVNCLSRFIILSILLYQFTYNNLFTVILYITVSPQELPVKRMYISECLLIFPWPIFLFTVS